MAYDCLNIGWWGGARAARCARRGTGARSMRARTRDGEARERSSSANERGDGVRVHWKRRTDGARAAVGAHHAVVFDANADTAKTRGDVWIVRWEV